MNSPLQPSKDVYKISDQVTLSACEVLLNDPVVSPSALRPYVSVRRFYKHPTYPNRVCEWSECVSSSLAAIEQLHGRCHQVIEQLLLAGGVRGAE